MVTTETLSTMKLDDGKAPISRGFLRYFPRAVESVSLISQFGFNKYGEWGGWKKVDDAFNRYDDAHGRHDVSLQRGEVHCPESGKLHLAHRAWNALATLELHLLEEEAKRAEATLEQDRIDQSWSDAAFADHQEQVKCLATKNERAAAALEGMPSTKFITCGKCDDPLECASKDRCFGR